MTPTLPTGRLGHRDVARVGFGAMQLGPMPGRPAVADDDAVALLRAAVDLGVDHLDTAAFYGPGTANAAIRTALAPYPADLQIVSKVGAVHTGGARALAQQPAQLRAQVEDNLVGLDVDRIDVVNIRSLQHGPGGAFTVPADQIVDLDDQLAELVALRDEGKVGAIGLSCVDADTLHRALPAGIVCVQNEYHLLDRTDEPVLEVCRANGIAWVPFFPLGSATPGRRPVVAAPAVTDTAARLGATPAQVALAWLLAHDPGVLLIPGTRSLDHLRENVASAAVDLDATALALLDAAHLDAAPPE